MRMCPVTGCGNKYYCPSHYIMPSKLKAMEALKNGTAEVKSRSAIAKFSDERLKQMATYRKLRDKFLKENPICEFPGCATTHVTLHHSEGRIGAQLTNVATFKSLCWPHHKHIEEHPEEAKKLKLSGSRLSTQQ